MPVYRDDWVKLLSSDGKTFTVAPDILRHSITIYTQIESAYKRGQTLNQSIPLKCTAEVFQQVLIFIQYHRFDPVLREKKESEDHRLSNWDNEFLNISERIMRDLLFAAHELKVHRLFGVICKKAGKYFKVSLEDVPNAEEQKKRLQLVSLPRSGGK